MKIYNPIKIFDESVAQKGLAGAMRQLLYQCGVTLETEKNPDLKTKLKSGAVLVVANHPAESDVPVLLASLEDREDIYIIANSSFTNLGKNIDKHIIPVHVNHRLYGFRGFNLIKLKLLRCFNKTEFLSAEDAHQKNIESINLAAKKIREGCLVVLYPAAGSGQGKWFSGVGHLIKNAGGSKQVSIVMAHIKGTSDKDYLRLIPGVSRLMKKPEVDFREPLETTPLLGLEAKEIAKNLESQYYAWVEQKESQMVKADWWEKVNFQLPKNAYLLVRTLVLWISVRIG